MEKVIKNIRNFQLSPRLKSIVFVFLCILISSLSALQFRAYPWFQPITAEAYSYSTTIVTCTVLLTLSTNVPRSETNEENGTETSKIKRAVFLILWGIFNSMSGIFYYLTLAKVPASLATIMTSLGPFLAMVLARIVLKESLTVLKVIALFFIVSGVVLTAFLKDSSIKISGNTDLFMGLIFGLCTSFSSAGYYVLSKKISSFNHKQAILVSRLIGLLISAAYIIISGNISIPPCGITAIILLLISSMSFLSSLAMLKAIGYGEAGVVSAVALGLNLMLSLIWDVIFFGLIPPVLQYTSVVLVLIGTGLNGFGHYLPFLKFLKKGV